MNPAPFVGPFECAPALGLLGVVVVLAGVVVWQSHAALGRLRAWPRIHSAAIELRRRRRWTWPLSLLALAILGVGIAGPRWGASRATELRGSRNLMVVLDVSRSMLAEQPSRLEKGLRAMRSLADTLTARGQARVGLIVFAARPHLLFPLTRDAHHLRFVVDNLSPDDLPRAVRGDPEAEFVSGTRIGIALKYALESFATARTGPHEILLVSDGDDPVNDDEFLAGVTLARGQGVPIHVVAVGEPDRPTPIPHNGDLLRSDGSIVQSRVHSRRLEEIAQQTGGLYFPVAAGNYPLGPALRDAWSQHRSAETTSQHTERRPFRLPWLLGAFLMSLAAVFLSRHPSHLLNHGKWCHGWFFRPGVAAAILVMIAAEPWRSAESAVARGNAAFARRDFDEAIRHYEAAQADTQDPGLVAFNLGAAYFRTGRFDLAVESYRRSLGDSAAPPARRARAWFDLGTALLNQAGEKDRSALEEAIHAFRACLVGEPASTLRRDAEFNLELAGGRWARAAPPSAPTGNDTKSVGPKTGTTPPATGDGSPKSGQGEDRGPSFGKTGEKPGDSASKKKSLALGSITVLPDQTKKIDLTPQDATALLESQLERIVNERRRAWRLQDAGPPRANDW